MVLVADLSGACKEDYYNSLVTRAVLLCNDLRFHATQRIIWWHLAPAGDHVQIAAEHLL